VLSELWVTAVALKDAAGEIFVLVGADVIAVPIAVGDVVADRVRKKFPGMKRGNFCFNASHTHYGPEIRMDKVPFFRIPEEYARKIEGAAERLAGAMVEAIVMALEGMAEARLFARKGEVGFARNRRAQGEGITDHEVPVLEVRGEDGKVRAVVFGYACHNTCMDPQDRMYSSDWAGEARRLIEEKWPGAVGVFVTGCGADQNPDPRGMQELSLKYGAELAAAIGRVMDGEGIELGAKLRVANGEARLEMVPVTSEWIEEGLASDDRGRRTKAEYLKKRLDRGEVLETSYPGPMQVVALGEELLMVMMSGETVVDWAHKFKGEFGDGAKRVWVAGYCNDMYGYVPTKRVQEEGGYEGGRATLWSWLPSAWTGSVEERVTGVVRDLVKQVSSNSSI
jgi:hypothetical protein